MAFAHVSATLLTQSRWDRYNISRSPAIPMVSPTMTQCSSQSSPTSSVPPSPRTCCPPRSRLLHLKGSAGFPRVDTASRLRSSVVFNGAGVPASSAGWVFKRRSSIGVPPIHARPTQSRRCEHWWQLVPSNATRNCESATTPSDTSAMGTSCTALVIHRGSSDSAWSVPHAADMVHSPVPTSCAMHSAHPLATVMVASFVAAT